MDEQEGAGVPVDHAERRRRMTARELRADNRRINIAMFKRFFRGDFRGGWAVLQETGDLREQAAELSEKTASATNATGRGVLWFIFPPLGMWRSMKHGQRKQTDRIVEALERLERRDQK